MGDIVFICGEGKLKSIVVVETRNMDRKRGKGETIVEQDNAGTTELTLVDEE